MATVKLRLEWDCCHWHKMCVCVFKGSCSCVNIKCWEFVPKPSSKSFYVVYEGRNILSACLLKYVNRLFRNRINSFEKKLGRFGMDRDSWISDNCVCARKGDRTHFIFMDPSYKLPLSCVWRCIDGVSIVMAQSTESRRGRERKRVLYCMCVCLLSIMMCFLITECV